MIRLAHMRFQLQQGFDVRIHRITDTYDLKKAADGVVVIQVPAQLQGNGYIANIMFVTGVKARLYLGLAVVEAEHRFIFYLFHQGRVVRQQQAGAPFIIVLFKEHQLGNQGSDKGVRAFDPFGLFDGAGKEYLPVHFLLNNGCGLPVVNRRSGKLVAQAQAERRDIQAQVGHLPEPVGDMRKADAGVCRPEPAERRFRFHQHADAAIDMRAQHQVFIIGMYVIRLLHPGDTVAKAKSQAESGGTVKGEIDKGEYACHMADIPAAAGVAIKGGDADAGIIIGLLPVSAAAGLFGDADFSKGRVGVAQVNGLGFIGQEETVVRFQLYG